MSAFTCHVQNEFSGSALQQFPNFEVISRAEGSAYDIFDFSKICVKSGKRHRSPLEEALIHLQWKPWPIKPEFVVTKYIDQFSSKSAQVLGPRGINRLQEFKRYSTGWDFGGGEPLSSASTALTDTFLSLFREFGEKPPSLFLTREGNLQLSWEDANGFSVEVEFFPDKIEYFIESNDEEGEIKLLPDNPTEGIRALIEKLYLSK